MSTQTVALVLPEMELPEVCHICQFLDILLEKTSNEDVREISWGSWEVVNEEGKSYEPFGLIEEEYNSIQIVSLEEDAKVNVSVPDSHRVLKVPHGLLVNVLGDTEVYVLVAKSKVEDAASYVQEYEKGKTFFSLVSLDSRHLSDQMLDSDFDNGFDIMGFLDRALKSDKRP